MNYDLMTEIIQHVFANLGIIQSQFVKLDNTKSLISKDLLLKEKLIFENDDGTVKNNIWGCQISAEEQEIKILVGDCSSDEDIKSYCLIVKLKDAPAYGLCLEYVYSGDDLKKDCPMIAVSVNDKDWMECTTFLQSTFLAGMEQIRDLGLSWSKCLNYDEQYKLMLSFIKYYNTFYEPDYYDNNEDFNARKES